MLVLPIHVLFYVILHVLYDSWVGYDLFVSVKWPLLLYKTCKPKPAKWLVNRSKLLLGIIDRPSNHEIDHSVTFHNGNIKQICSNNDNITDISVRSIKCGTINDYDRNAMLRTTMNLYKITTTIWLYAIAKYCKWCDLWWHFLTFWSSNPIRLIDPNSKPIIDVSFRFLILFTTQASVLAVAFPVYNWMGQICRHQVCNYNSYSSMFYP